MTVAGARAMRPHWCGPWFLHRWGDMNPVWCRRYFVPAENKGWRVGTLVGPAVTWRHPRRNDLAPTTSGTPNEMTAVMLHV